MQRTQRDGCVAHRRNSTSYDSRKELIKVGKGLVRKLADLDRIVQLQNEERFSARVEHVQAVIEAKHKAFKKLYILPWTRG